ncbi:MAG: hypothetical protein AAGA57_03760 [Planctomycetota bacterium]
MGSTCSKRSRASFAIARASGAGEPWGRPEPVDADPWPSLAPSPAEASADTDTRRSFRPDARQWFA